ncbi:MAG: protein-glutamate O-methyltransferase [Methylomicrobium sp.]
MEMTTQEFKAFQQFLVQSCGIVLSDTKQYLVKNRLSGLLPRFGLRSFAELLGALQSHSTAAARIKVEVIEAMTTNETFWFRDEGHFVELVGKVLPQIALKRSVVKIWSAACSSGQEPYSISMCVDEMSKISGQSCSVSIVGTDISEAVLTQARRAVYSASALSRGIDAAQQKRYFVPVDDGFKVKPEISARVRFQQFNLLKPFTALGRFDVIFCRNVLIYFSDELKRDILSRMLQVLEPGGFLFLSSSEVIPAGLSGFETIRGERGRYYRKSL